MSRWTWIAVVTLFVVAPSFAQQPPVTRQRAPQAQPQVQPGNPNVLALECRNPGSHQDVAKTPIVKNTSTFTLPKGSRIRWNATDGDQGNIVLKKDLAPGQEAQGLGKAGQGYTCTAKAPKPKQPTRMTPKQPTPMATPSPALSVRLECRNPGSHQDVAKTPMIKNTTAKIVKRGAKIHWTATDGDKGVVTLQQDLKPNQEVQGTGSAGQGYTCTATVPRNALKKPTLARAPAIGNPAVVSTKTDLPCRNPGSHQDVAKTPRVKNTTGSTLTKGTVIHWKASDGDQGQITLEQNLAVNAEAQGIGSAGQGYTCTAWMSRLTR